MELVNDIDRLGCWQLLLRMNTAYFQAGSAVVEADQPADRICIIVSGRFVSPDFWGDTHTLAAISVLIF
jgi:hypothetical protein